MTALSKRGAQNVGTYIGHLPVSLIEVVDDSDWIDLSFAENYIIRKEVLEVFRDAAATQVTDKVSETKKWLCGDLTDIPTRISTGLTDSGAKHDF
jgi:hypothetical protein